MVKKAHRDYGFSGPVGDLTTEQWKVILAAFGGRCAYCGEAAADLTMDHVIPASKGGRHTASNVVPACGFCNRSKKDKDLSPTFYPADWAEIERVISGRVSH